MSDIIRKTRIEKIASGGTGLARVDGKSLFIDGGIPGETVICRVTKEHGSWSQAELLDIEEVSPDRVKPVCGLYGKCGGCNLQHLSYPAQLSAKIAILKDTFLRIGGIEAPEPRVFESEPWEYRNRMQFHAARDSQKPESSWCLKAKENSATVPVFDCPIADSGIRDLLRGDEEKKRALMPPHKDRFNVYSRNGLLLSEGGVPCGRTQFLDRELTLDASVFFQSNGVMLEALIYTLREIAEGSPCGNSAMADLYCGVGTFAVFLGEMFAKVDLVEENKTALALARENLMWVREGIAPPAFHAQRSEKWAAENRVRHGFVIVDPPRQGLNQTLALALASGGPPMLAYVSCDPATLARDSKILLSGGFSLVDLYFFDFYPQTSHIESLAVFMRS